MSALAAVPTNHRVDDDDALLSKTEGWFVSRGLPFFIEDRKATDDVFTRALPLLAIYFVISMMVVLSLRLTVLQRIGGAALGVGLLFVLYVARNLIGGRGALARPRRIGWVEIGALMIIPPIVDAIVRKDWRVSGLQSWKVTGIDLGVNLAILLGIYAFTSALLPLIRWTVKRTFQELGEVFDLAARALPLLFLFNSFLFISKDVWEFAGEMTRHRLWGVVGLFAIFTMLFLIYRLPNEVRRVAAHDDHDTISHACHGTPMEGVADRVHLHDGAVSLNRKQRTNVLMVLFVGQMLQVLLLALLVFVFFAGFGWVTMDSKHIAEWTGQQPENAIVFGHELGDYLGFNLDKKLFQVAIFLAAVSAFFFAVSSMTDEAYKEQFYARMNGELETAIQVRRVYLALYQGRHSRFDDSDPAATHVHLRFPRPSNGRRWFEQPPYSSINAGDAYPTATRPGRSSNAATTYLDGSRLDRTYLDGTYLGDSEEPIQHPATEIES